jgi:ribosomal protein L12E/L44/L45/RPP1/RPP2
MRYPYAAGFLSFAGRELTRGSMPSMIKSIGMGLNYGIIEITLRNDYLIANVKEASKKNMKSVLESVGMHPDTARIRQLESVSYL